MHEINEANLLWQQAVSGQGQVLLVSGEPGVGKTRFAHELAQAVRQSGGCVLAGECYAEGGAPYAPLAQVIRGTLESTTQAGFNLSDETLTDLLPILPSLRLRLTAILPGINLDPRAEQQRVFEGFVAFCSAVSSQGPLLLFIDDVQWADPDTLFLLKYLARRGRNLPLLIVMAYREAELELALVLKEVLVDFNRQRLAIQLKLNRLNRSETGDLLAAIFAEEIDPDFLDGIFHQTEGNPFFIEEVCKGLVEAGQLFYRDGHWQRPAMAEISIPQTVREAILARVQKLPASTQEVLLMAAILGSDFDFETLKHACAFDDETLIDALEHAARAQLITELKAGQAGALKFSFVHVLIPTSLRESVIHVRRRLLHLRAAQAIETVYPDDFELLAYQYTAAGDDERARQYLVCAGDRAQPIAPSEAVGFFRAALELWPEEEQAGRAEILARLGYCLWVIDDIQGSLECYQTAYTLFDAVANRLQSGEMQRMLGRLYWHQAERGLAWQHYQQALAILEKVPELLELARAIGSISQMLMIAYDNDQAILWGERALKLAQTLGAEDVVASVLNNIGCSRAQKGDFESGGSILRESLERSIKAGLRQEACRAYYNLSLMYQHQSRYEKARQLFEELYTYSIKSYSKFYTDDTILSLAWINWYTGKWKTALKYRAEMVEPNDIVIITSAKRIFAMIDLDLGQVEEALSELEESLPAAVRANEYQTTIPHWGQLTRAYAALGQEAKAVHAIQQILTFISGLGYISNESTMSLLFACQWSAAHFSAGSSEAAYACLAQLERLVQQYHSSETVAALAEGGGCVRLAEENVSEAAQDFRQAVSSWEMIGRPYDQARALNYLGRALTTLRDEPGAQAAYHEALVIIDALSAQLEPHSARQTSFLNSPLASEIRQAAGGVSSLSAE